MPRTITLTPEQERAYEAGQPVTIRKRTRRYIIVAKSGIVYDYTTTDDLSALAPGKTIMLDTSTVIAATHSESDSRRSPGTVRRNAYPTIKSITLLSEDKA
jgi:hypothetical protein